MHKWILWVERPDTKKINIYRQNARTAYIAMSLTQVEFMHDNQLNLPSESIVFIVREDYNK